MGVIYKEKSIIVAGLARDCAENLRKNLIRIEAIRPYFKDMKVVILENDSIDKTIEVIQDYELKHKGVITKSFKETRLDISETSGLSLGRMQRMSSYRNELMEMVRSAGTFDYVIIIDWDIWFFDPQNILVTINQAPVDWGALFSNGMVQYFYANQDGIEYRYTRDTIALLDKMHDYDTIDTHYYSHRHRFQMLCDFGERMCQEDFVEVTSAFGGLAIYKYDAITNCHYETRKVNSNYLCEHVAFNSAVKINGYKNYIAAQLPTYINVKLSRRISYLLLKYFPQIFKIRVIFVSFLK